MNISSSICAVGSLSRWIATQWEVDLGSPYGEVDVGMRKPKAAMCALHDSAEIIQRSLGWCEFCGRASGSDKPFFFPVHVLLVELRRLVSISRASFRNPPPSSGKMTPPRVDALATYAEQHLTLAVLLVGIVLSLAYQLLFVAYRLYFHPLRKFPGLRQACVSENWLYQETKGGSPEETFETLHRQFGMFLCKSIAVSDSR